MLAVVAFLGGVSLGLSEAQGGEGRELSRASVVAIHEGATPLAVSAPQKEGSVAPVATGVRTVRVLPGDTLWSIAGRTFPDADPRAVVTAFREANGGQLRSLQVGAELIVPSNV
jgi:Tfp pilus assembly protein FimV